MKRIRKFSCKQYEYLRALLKTDPGELKDKDKKVVKRINDLLSGNLSIPTFLENMEALEPELFGISEIKRQELERLRKQKEEEEERIQKEKEREKALKEEEKGKAREKQLEKERRDIEAREKAAKEAQLEAAEMASRLEQERLHRLREDEERAKKERKRIEEEKEKLKAQPKEKGYSYNKIMVAAAILGILLLGYWMITNDKKTFTNSIGMEFVLIPAGEFDMGSPLNEVGRYDDEGPVHHVTISNAFYLSKYEVTQKQWRDVLGASPSYFTGDELPVEQVSWGDVQQFIQKLNEKEGTTKYRLPSEAEWEYAARAGTTTR